jgi:hypothetical protein
MDDRDEMLGRRLAAVGCWVMASVPSLMGVSYIVGTVRKTHDSSPAFVLGLSGVALSVGWLLVLAGVRLVRRSPLRHYWFVLGVAAATVPFVIGNPLALWWWLPTFAAGVALLARSR